ncbi:transcriptional regulator, AraC family [Chryseobacterium wanjuense]|uniref:Transcriptional regulator, AraC family n=1 Tax=Chryseobacterium wanjuense TaxID=356305 RepID=A0A1I0RTX7_9FLAO|nr:AraC family transcriptional regulator [Chryseobacterium wanjuense]SEW44772.1 transcriptional regulator, AraC family [Chryseobacterium wanjuense]
MKNQPDRKILFRSDDIEICLQEDLYPEKFSRSMMIEGKSSFNLLFLLSQNIHLEAQDCGTRFSFKKNQYILHYSPQESTAELWTENLETLHYLQIQINYDYIFHLINPESNKENADILENMIKNNYIFLHKQTPPYMTVEMHMIVKEIVSYSKKGVMQKLFIEAKIIKLLILIFEQFNEKNTVEESPEIPSMIKKFVDENYHENIKVEEIGKRIGINQNKIRKEFKAQYNITVSDYIAELRMLKAKKMIINKKIMIKEIAIECGYEYVQNFTRAFKKKFGISPEKLRNG